MKHFFRKYLQVFIFKSVAFRKISVSLIINMIMVVLPLYFKQEFSVIIIIFKWITDTVNGTNFLI